MAKPDEQASPSPAHFFLSSQVAAGAAKVVGVRVFELIRELQGLDPDHRVLVDGYEAGCDEPVVYKSVAGRDPEPAGYSGDWIPKGDNFERDLPPNPEPVVVIGRGLNQ